MAAAPQGRTAETAVAAGAAIGWSVWHLRWSEAGRAPRFLLAADLLVMAALCLTQGLTVPQEQGQHGQTWVLVAISVVVVSVQFTHPPLPGALVAVTLAAADLTGVMLARPDTWPDAVPQIAWLLVQAALGRGLHEVVVRRCRA
ncbi:hypothetical protein, partial [Streptomyces sp. SM12]|uniref:hypothetical protein n=1 Tax=Streptomyces sp. SM12 TaxID=1071602 RepID=UPI0011B0E0AA